MVKPDEIIRSSRKTLSISIDAQGRLIVRAPMRCAEERIFAFLREKESWILKKRAEKRGVGISLPPDDLEGYSFLLLGAPVTVRLIDEKKVGYDAENAIVYLPRENAKDRLVKWLKENARRIFLIVTEREAARMQTTFSSLSVSSARGKWGSCSAENALRYSFRLLYCPKEIIDYVVVHELAHTRHKNHSKAFWSEVEKYIPDWKARREWLKRYSVLTRIF